MLRAILRRIARREEGVALVISLGSLAVVSVVVVMTASVSLQSSETSNTDTDSKRAFEAAEAALQVATYRLNNLGPTDYQCVGTSVQAPANGFCTATEDLGNNAKWTYRMTPVLSTGKCAGHLAKFSPTEVVAPRCVTGTGSVNGEERRVQARLSAFRGAPVFPLRGILGVTGVELNNASTVTGALGSNGLIDIKNTSVISEGLVLGPGAPEPKLGGNTVAPVTYRSPDDGPWVLAPVEIGNSATVNDNGNWTLSGSGKSMTYDAQYRELTVTKGQLTLMGGTYNLCKLKIENNASIVVAAGAKVRLFIDSPEPDRVAQSGCRPGTGTIEVNNNFDNPGTADSLQIYVYGADPAPGVPVIDFKNQATLNMAIHAPRGTISFKNKATITGAVNGNKVEFKNSLTYTGTGLSGELANLRATTTTLYKRTGWRECSKRAPAGDLAGAC